LQGDFWWIIDGLENTLPGTNRLPERCQMWIFPGAVCQVLRRSKVILGEHGNRGAAFFRNCVVPAGKMGKRGLK
jgi:hypothetical protein